MGPNPDETRQTTTLSCFFLDVHFRNYGNQFLERRRKLVGMRPRTKSLHLWNGRVKSFVANTYASTRYCFTCKNGWTLASYVANLLVHRWVQRLLSWHPFGARSVSRPRTRWESNFWVFFCRPPPYSQAHGVFLLWELAQRGYLSHEAS